MPGDDRRRADIARIVTELPESRLEIRYPEVPSQEQPATRQAASIPAAALRRTLQANPEEDWEIQRCCSAVDRQHEPPGPLTQGRSVPDPVDNAGKIADPSGTMDDGRAASQRRVR